MIRLANGPNVRKPLGNICREGQVCQIGRVEIAAIGPSLVKPVMQRAAQAAKSGVPQSLVRKATLFSLVELAFNAVPPKLGR